ncbi:polysaccharide pyruvyl transferase family protein [Haloferula rosea]|uniref:Polysaccharide pyruvyl transferase family protein n=2 Tax=Haloferula rosea TaxID=490093 RepID=A0A934VEY7_9BACT|nr:polysaccharide pyruvyl transferase family protein [Haloferula rosea]
MIRELGHEAEIINYQNRTHHRWENPFSSMRLTPKGIRTAFRRRSKARPFREVVAGLTSAEFTTRPEAVDWKAFDSVVVGSDVVWDYSSPQYGADPCFFGQHPVQDGVRFVSYAASCGPADTGKVPTYVREGIQRFEAIGVRDRKTLEIARGCGGGTPVLVADPTWLRGDPRIEWPDAPSEPYVLVYGNALTSRDDNEAVHRWARDNGLKLVSAASPALLVDQRYDRLTPFQWVDLYRNASAVVTATLHGLLYAVKFRKPFVMKLLPQTRDKAITTLEGLDCMDRLFPQGESVRDLDLDLALGSSLQNASVVSSPFSEESRQFLQASIAP